MNESNIKMVGKKRKNKLPGDKWTPLMVLIALLLVIYFILVAYPLFWMVINSLKTHKEIYKDIWGMPSTLMFSNYAQAWKYGISNYFINSVIVTGSTIIAVLLMAALAAYSLARFRFKGNGLIFMMCMGGMMLSPQVTLIPLYKILQGLHIHDTYLAMIIPYAAYRIPISVMLIRSFFLTIPKELEESAALDGCSSLGVFFRIFLPMSKPILLTCTILTAYYAWNEFLYAIIFINSEKFKTIPSGLMNLRDALLTDWGILLAGMVISSLPLIVVFLLMQKQFIRGMTAGSVKG